jgi:hypothetical protein
MSVIADVHLLRTDSVTLRVSDARSVWIGMSITPPHSTIPVRPSQLPYTDRRSDPMSLRS